MARAAKRGAGTRPCAVLRSIPTEGRIIVDAETELTDVPREAWDYQLGNRSAIDWVLGQYKEKTPRDKNVASRFNAYRFSDYKESVIDLLSKVVRVSVETVAVTTEMKLLDRASDGVAK